MHNKIPYSFWGAVPPDLLLQRYSFRISPSPQQILDPPLNWVEILVGIILEHNLDYQLMFVRMV